MKSKPIKILPGISQFLVEFFILKTMKIFVSIKLYFQHSQKKSPTTQNPRIDSIRNCSGKNTGSLSYHHVRFLPPVPNAVLHVPIKKSYCRIRKCKRKATKSIKVLDFLIQKVVSQKTLSLQLQIHPIFLHLHLLLCSARSNTPVEREL